MIKIKKGVKIKYLDTTMINMLQCVDIVWEKLTLVNPVITSMFDGKHMKGSLHYKGLALDVRSYNLSKTEKEDVLRSLRKGLRKHYDVILEKTHFHIEYDPK